MIKRVTFARSLAICIVFLGVAIAVYFKNVRLVDAIGLFVCGFASGVSLVRAVIAFKDRNK